MERATTCCFTGHRPEKLPWYYDESDPRCLRLKEKLGEALEEAYGDGYRHFVCGMARGCDFYFVEGVLALREHHPDVTLEGARPWEGQADGWRESERQRYENLLEKCDYETLVQQHFDRGCMLRRNRYMVNKSARLIAAYDGNPQGGTASTVLYALREKLELKIVDVIAPFEMEC